MSFKSQVMKTSLIIENRMIRTRPTAKKAQAHGIYINTEPIPASYWAFLGSYLDTVFLSGSLRM